MVEIGFSDWKKSTKEATNHTEARAAELARWAGAGMAFLVAVTPLLQRVEAKADVSSVRQAALVSTGVIGAKTAHVSPNMQPDIPVRPEDARRGIHSITLET